MVDLTALDRALGERIGSARAAGEIARAVRRATDDGDLSAELTELRTRARTIARTCEALAQTRTGRTSAIRRVGRATRNEALEVAQTQLDAEGEVVAGLEHLVAVLATETGEWDHLATLAAAVGDGDLLELAESVRPLHRTQLEVAHRCRTRVPR